MSDRLERSVRALREASDGRSDEAARTRARVLLRASKQRRRSRVVALVVAPLAAALVVSMAWAASNGHLRGWIENVASLVRPERASQPATTALPSVSVAPVTSGDAASSEPSSRVEGESALDAGAAPPASRARVAPAPSASASESTPDAGPSEEESLYQRAHQAHFVARDAAAALRGWDDYLRAYPNGRFALEARYNRALALVRLARYVEARAALAPFAAGQYGGYRQREARALLDAMDAGL